MILGDCNNNIVWPSDNKYMRMILSLHGLIQTIRVSPVSPKRGPHDAIGSLSPLM